MSCENGFKRDPGTQCEICQCNEPEQEVEEEARDAGIPGAVQCACTLPMSCEFGFEVDPDTGCEICR